MKKIGIIFFFLCTVLVTIPSTYSYLHFEKLEVVGNGKLLKDYDNSDYDKYYNHLGDNQFSDWKVHIVNNLIKVKFTSETLFSFYNNGKSSIAYTYEQQTKRIESYDLNVSGSIKIKTNKNTKIFGEGLDASISASYKWDVKEEYQEKLSVKLSIEPGTQLIYYLYGEGKITNGVAKKYFFWVEIARGGFEIFTLSSHYPRLEMRLI